MHARGVAEFQHDVRGVAELFLGTRAEHGEILGRHNGIDDALRGKILGQLDARREGAVGQQFIDLGAEEADERTGFCDGDVPE